MGQPFATGVPTGQPAVPGLQSFSDGAMRRWSREQQRRFRRLTPSLATTPATSIPTLSGGEGFTAAHVPVEYTRARRRSHTDRR